MAFWWNRSHMPGAHAPLSDLERAPSGCQQNGSRNGHGWSAVDRVDGLAQVAAELAVHALGGLLGGRHIAAEHDPVVAVRSAAP